MNVKIRALEQNEDIPRELLLSADPDPDLQKSYLNEGKCFVAVLNNKVIGEYVLIRINSQTAEVKNIAVDEEFQGLGIGQQLLNHAFKATQELGCQQIQISTGNSSLRQLKLYQKMGFEIERLVKNYFIDNYGQQLFEDGIQCKHLIILRKDLSDSKRTLN